MNCNIKLANGDILTLICPKAIIGKSYYSSIGGSVDALVYYTISDEDIDKLKNNQLSVLRIETTEGHYDYDIPDNKSEVIKKQLILIDK